MKHIIFLLLIILILSGCEKISNQLEKNVKSGQQNVVINVPIFNSAPKVTKAKTVSKQPELPESLDLSVAFAPQAPNANWDPLHNEACEEASMIMVAKYFKGEKLDKEIMETEIQKLVKWEEENGYPIDLTAGQIARILEKYFGLKASVSKEVTVDKIKKELAAGNLIIVPLAGRDVGNPYYRQPGPLYHMLVIRGYDEDEFITNDPGTRRGEAYAYKYGNLLWAVHDWVGGIRVYKDPRPEPDMRKGEKVMVLVEGNR